MKKETRKKILEWSTYLSGAYTVYLIIKDANIIQVIKAIMEVSKMSNIPSLIIVLIFIGSLIIILREKYKEWKTRRANLQIEQERLSRAIDSLRIHIFDIKERFFTAQSIDEKTKEDLLSSIKTKERFWEALKT